MCQAGVRARIYVRNFVESHASSRGVICAFYLSRADRWRGRGGGLNKREEEERKLRMCFACVHPLFVCVCVCVCVYARARDTFI